MPLHWTIDSRARLLSARAEGDVSLDDALTLLETISGAGALGYRKLFDGRAGSSTMSGEELLTLCANIRSYHAQGGSMGALAVVGTSAQSWLFARLLSALAAADRPMKVFESFRQARNWINEQPDAGLNAQGNEAADISVRSPVIDHLRGR